LIESIANQVNRSLIEVVLGPMRYNLRGVWREVKRVGDAQ